MKTLYFVFPIALILFLLGSCTINEPVLPQFSKRIVIEFTPEQVSMADALDDDTLRDSLANNGDTLIYLDIADSTERQSIERSDLAFKADDKRVVEEVGLIRLDEPEPEQTDPVFLADLLGLTLSVGDTLPPYPSRNLVPPPQVVTFDSYQEVDIDSGSARVRLHNNLFIDINSGAKVYLYDNIFDSGPDGGLIDSLQINQPIVAGTTVLSPPLDLSGKLLSNELRTQYRLPVSGSDTSNVLDQSEIESHISSEVILSDVNVTRAVAEVPQQEVTETDEAEIDTEDKMIRLVEIEQGTMYLDIENLLQISANLEVTLQNLFTPQGEPRVIDVFAEANASVRETVNLDGHQLRSEQAGDFVNTLSYKVRALTVPSDGFVEVSSNDSIVVNFSMDSAFAGYFEGRLEQTELDIDPVETDRLKELQDIEGGLLLPDLELVLDVYNEINFDVATSLQLKGTRRENGEIVDELTIPVDDVIAAGESGAPRRTRIVLDGESSSPSIVDLMALLPTELQISGNGLIDGDGSVALNDAIWVEYTVQSPLTLDIQNTITAESDPDSLGDDELGEDVREQLTENVGQLALIFEGENTLGLSPQLYFYLVADKDELFDPSIADSGRKVVLSAEIEAADVGSDGFTSGAKPFTVRWQLTESQLQIFNFEKIYYAAQVLIPPTSGEVTFRASDALLYRGNMEIELMVDPDE